MLDFEARYYVLLEDVSDLILFHDKLECIPHKMLRIVGQLLRSSVILDCEEVMDEYHRRYEKDEKENM